MYKKSIVLIIFSLLILNGCSSQKEKEVSNNISVNQKETPSISTTEIGSNPTPSPEVSTNPLSSPISSPAVKPSSSVNQAKATPSPLQKSSQEQQKNIFKSTTNPISKTSSMVPTNKKTTLPSDAQKGKPTFQRPDIMGEITSISGGKISIKVIKMPEQSAGNSGPNNTNPGAQGGGRPPQRKTEYTGETKVLTVPANLEITTRTRGANGFEEKSLKVAELKSGDVLSVWYKDKASGAILRASVRNQKP